MRQFPVILIPPEVQRIAQSKPVATEFTLKLPTVPAAGSPDPIDTQEALFFTGGLMFIVFLVSLAALPFSALSSTNNDLLTHTTLTFDLSTIFQYEERPLSRQAPPGPPHRSPRELLPGRPQQSKLGGNYDYPKPLVFRTSPVRLGARPGSEEAAAVRHRGKRWKRLGPTSKPSHSQRGWICIHMLAFSGAHGQRL